MVGPEEAAVGAGAAAAVKWALEKVPDLVSRFRNRELSFIQDEHTIDLVKRSRKQAEYSLLRKHAQGTHKRVLIQIGLTLRRLDGEGDHEGVQNLRQKIVRKYQTPGLHLAEAAQSGILSLIHEELLRMDLSDTQLDEEMNDVVESIDHYVEFIKEETEIDPKAAEISGHLTRDYPRVFVVAGIGKAVPIALEVSQMVAKRVDAYAPARYQEPANPLSGNDPEKVFVTFSLR